MTSYSYYKQRDPGHWGTSQYQFAAPPAPTYQPQPSWRGEEYYRAHGGIEDETLFGSIWNKVRGQFSGGRLGGYSRDEAKDWHRRVYSGQVDVTKLLPNELGAAAGYEAIRLWEAHKNIYQLPLSSDTDREREALAGIAIAESTKLWKLATSRSYRHGRSECCEVAAATAERIFNRQYDNDDYGRRSRSRSRSIVGYGDGHRSSSHVGSYHGEGHRSSSRVGSYNGDAYVENEDPYHVGSHGSSHRHKHRKHRRSSSASYYPSSSTNISSGQPIYIPPSPRQSHTSIIQPGYINASPQPSYAALPQPYGYQSSSADPYYGGTSAPSGYAIPNYSPAGGVQYAPPPPPPGVQYVFPQAGGYPGSSVGLPQPPLIIGGSGQSDGYRRRRSHSQVYPGSSAYGY